METMHQSRFSPNSIWWIMVVIWGATPMQCIAVLPCTCFAPRCSPAISWLPKSVSVLQSRCVSWHLGTAWTKFCFQTGRQFGIKSAFRHGSCREAIIRWIQQEVSFNLLVLKRPSKGTRKLTDWNDTWRHAEITGFRFRSFELLEHIYIYIHESSWFKDN